MRFIAVMMFFHALPAFATVTAGNCPEAFEGRVKEVIEEVGPESGLAVQKVIFSNHQTLKGKVKEQVLLDMLKNGPFKIVPGADYKVQLRNGRLCWIERI